MVIGAAYDCLPVSAPPHVGAADMGGVTEDQAARAFLARVSVGDVYGGTVAGAPASNVSLLVVDEPEAARGCRVGHRDVWSVGVWGVSATNR